MPKSEDNESPKESHTFNAAVPNSTVLNFNQSDQPKEDYKKMNTNYCSMNREVNDVDFFGDRAH